MPGQRRSRLLLALGLTAALLLPTAQAQAQAVPKGAVVTDGQARFQVLSPTLIRTEFAGDEKFVDAGTFNVVGRQKFGQTRFTSRRSNGWLTIDTGKLLLRYKTGSGAFGDDNLRISLKAGEQAVEASPWAGSGSRDCAFGELCEAEDLSLDGLGTATNHSGYTGKGFVAGFESTGNALRFTVDAPSSGGYQLALRYANDRGADGQVTERSLSLLVDAGEGRRFTLPPSGSWDTWAVVTVPLELTAGRHELTVLRAAGDSGQVNVDSLAVTPAGATFPAPQPPQPQPCAFGTVCETETGALAGGARSADDHNGFSGEGFVAGLESEKASGTVTVTGVPRAGKYRIQLRYANAQAGSDPVRTRKVSVRANSATASTLELKPTSGWDYWHTVSAPLTLAAGTNTVVIGCPAADSCHVNIDTVALTTAQAPLLAPHAALGGYRRGLDGVNGDTKTSPGLLYQDGWSLLDDTGSALYDTATKKVTQRVSHAGGYQDGYVFGYGQDYPAALSDLSTLTGPTLTLPKWAYGVWYAEYYDRTASEFQSVVKRFEDEKIPLDVLVVDTDFKKPDRWNGWSVDETRFPDPDGFIDWLHERGVRTTWNIHPSILGSDPKFAQAQATARGRLQRTGCNGGADCYTFDWGDPDQLKAYLDLHDDIEQQGVDFWWLDWCCDSSKSTLAGVTPDAWINQQYADRNGFAFSRAYGSLQAGGYSSPTAIPTGPWADKRTTLHFTGDTISTWESLRMEVGYTPGESAATGLAAISHDIGGHTGGLQEPGSEPGSTKLPDDLYARWVQLGTFQPIDRLHSNHSDRLPWQYGEEAQASATKFLKLRNELQSYTYRAARKATRTGTPITRPLYLDHPEQQEAYATAGAEYLYGPDYLVAPVTTAGESATTTVWFPPGSTWKNYFTGRKYRGGTTAEITSGLDTMPVFVRQ
ncbi:carbohydrate-binding protein [Kineosporia sp. J2-2]|uniref:Carbohydrate-binding protein n=1 Tax=Kineosporia corallincola TaxID=2835133 RepID=A0ABS5TD89_9ACTN|nr:TIM-barrel domain-containing protein [Kineosporia corallincola]MBT0769047.1 carbohydrate-binding protein [Kineosporia corallincola]